MALTTSGQRRDRQQSARTVPRSCHARPRQPGRRCLPAGTHRRRPLPPTPSPAQPRRRRGRNRPPAPRRPQRDRAMNTTLSSPETQARPDATLSSAAARPAGKDVEQLPVHDSDSQGDAGTPTISADVDTPTPPKPAELVTKQPAPPPAAPAADCDRNGRLPDSSLPFRPHHIPP